MQWSQNYVANAYPKENVMREMNTQLTGVKETF